MSETAERRPAANLEARELQRRHRRVQEQLYATALVRRFSRITLVLWVLTFAVAFLHDNPWPPFAAHSAGLVFALLITQALHDERTERSPARLRNLFIALGTILNAVLSVEALLTGGLASVFLPFQVLPMSGIAVVSIPWNRLAPRGIPTIIGPWVVTVVGLLVTPALRPQLEDPNLLRQSAALFATEMGAVALFVFISDAHRRLRGQLYHSRSLGRYQLRERVGGGGMGEVWAAYDTAMKRDVALKILKTAGERTSQQRFEREVQALASLTHPNTVRVFDYATTEDGLRYYAMELLRGSTIAALVRRDGPLPWPRAIRMIAATASALGEAHSRGIVHRDVKPENIFIAEAGGEADFVKLLDFGVAHLLDPDRAALTTTGLTLGTPSYMSPEAILGRSLGPASDVYGLGATLYFTLTGVPPHARDTTGAMLKAHLESEVEPPSSCCPEANIPQSVEDVCMRCLSKSPSQRYASGTEVADALHRLASSASAVRNEPID